MNIYHVNKISMVKKQNLVVDLTLLVCNISSNYVIGDTIQNQNLVVGMTLLLDLGFTLLNTFFKLKAFEGKLFHKA